MIDHPIVQQSFDIIDQEIGTHGFTPAEYTIVRRVIHSTADFDFTQLMYFSPGVIEQSVTAIQQGIPIITDVNMVKQGIQGMVKKTFDNPLFSAIEYAGVTLPQKTRTETGLLNIAQQFPHGIFVIGNAPTALLSLCELIDQSKVNPALVIGVPVGFVSVIESKIALSKQAVPQIRVEGRKGGSPVAAAILNALMVLAWESVQATK
ncbi:MAG: cobalt-precorrin-8X methylmutase [Microcoleaceae cyanobacterium]